ncbi:hypothetical protein H0H87_008796 [Tephrocybe sp. NHM501043]|nr:hypothetical protein H0H87_008796 [Tephrocybe sp. NHM501043]
MVDRALEKIKIKIDGASLPTANSSILLRKFMKIKHVNDGQVVADVYKQGVADYIKPLASMPSLHPNVAWWTSSLALGRIELSHNQFPGNHALHENISLCFGDDPNNDSSTPAEPAWDTMESSSRETFERASDLFLSLATFHFYCEGAPDKERLKCSSSLFGKVATVEGVPGLSEHLNEEHVPFLLVAVRSELIWHRAGMKPSKRLKLTMNFPFHSYQTLTANLKSSRIGY